MDLIDPCAARTLGRTGLRVSQLGFGCSTMGVLRSGEDEATATAALASAWRSGVRYFDTSPWYGRGLSEHRTGAFLRHVPRADYLLSSKVGRLLSPLPPDATPPADTLPFGARFDYSYDATLRSLEHSLQRLGLSHIDMLILHDLSPRWHGEALDEQFGIAMDGAQRALCELRGCVSALSLCRRLRFLHAGRSPDLVGPCGRVATTDRLRTTRRLGAGGGAVQFRHPRHWCQCIGAILVRTGSARDHSAHTGHCSGMRRPWRAPGCCGDPVCAGPHRSGQRGGQFRERAAICAGLRMAGHTDSARLLARATRCRPGRLAPGAGSMSASPGRSHGASTAARCGKGLQ